MSASSPGGEESRGFGGAAAKNWVAILLCVASVLGPDVLMQQGQEQGLPILPRPPLASALSEEQVKDGTDAKAIDVSWGTSFVRVLGY